VLSRLGRDVREEDQWADEWIGVDEEEIDNGKENRPSSLVVRLEDLIIRPAARGGKRLLLSQPGTPRQISRPGTPFRTTFSDDDILLQPYTDTNDQSDSDSDDGSDDGLGSFEFSSPGADDWTVVVTEEGSLKYSVSNGELVASASSTTTVIVMPCTW